VDEYLTGFENLDMVGRLYHLGKERSRTRARELLEQFDLAEAGDRPTKTYSGGMRRRLDLAAALVAKPEVLFLDEPTTGLDPRSRSDLWSVIADLVADGTTVLLTTQYLEEADRLAERIAVVDRGRVIATGTPAELKAGLGSTVLEIAMTGEGSALLAAEVLFPLGVQPPVVEGSTVMVTVSDGARLLLEALRILDAEDLTPTGVTLREPSLDDVFLALTGEHAGSGPATGDADATLRGAA
jgi:ABC-2 type transport system ATP-binding protein